MNSKVNEWLGFEIKDEWFIRFHADKLSEEFCKWWRMKYSIPGALGVVGIDHETSAHDYYIRLAVDMEAWNACSSGMMQAVLKYLDKKKGLKLHEGA